MRQSEPTVWEPESKPIWFTEMGCAAIDKGTNQPNKFLDPKSSESSLPYHSNGFRDEYIQMQYLRAMFRYWSQTENNPQSSVYDGAMVDMDRAHVWAWDARPFPFFFPAIARFGAMRRTMRGAIGSPGASRLVRWPRLWPRSAPVPGRSISMSRGLYGVVRGYTVGDVSEARAALQPLMLRYGFDAIERDGVLSFRMRDGLQDGVQEVGNLAIHDEIEGQVERLRASEADLVGRVRLRFVQADGNFEVLSEEAVLPDEATHAVATSEIPIALTRGEGRQVVERWLSEARVGRDSARFALPPSRLDLAAGDVVRLDDNARSDLYRIDRIEMGASQMVEAVRIEPETYRPVQIEEDAVSLSEFVPPVPVFALFLDLPLMTGGEVPHAPHVAITAQPWPGSVAVYSSGSDSNYGLNRLIAARATVGVTKTNLRAARPGLIDRGDGLIVELTSGALESVEEEALLSGANLAAIGDGTPEVGSFSSFVMQRLWERIRMC